MSARLLRDQAAYHVAALRRASTLTALQAARLDTILGTVADDGRFLLRTALVAGDFPDGDARAQDAFQDFRRRVNQAAIDAGVELALEVDSRKASPDHRHGWFTGGDLVDEGIATFTEKGALSTGIENPVEQSVAELGTTRVYISHPLLKGPAARKLTGLLRQLRETLAAVDPDHVWDVTDVGSVGLGEDADAARGRLCAQADVRVALVSPAYFAADPRERRRVLAVPERVAVFAFSGLPDGRLDLDPLGVHHIRHRKKPWEDRTSPGQRREFVEAIIDELRRMTDPLQHRAGEDCSPDESLADWSARLARRRQAGDSRSFVEPDLTETALDESHLDRAAPPAGTGVAAVGRLVDWALNPDTSAPRLCALLGDVGMGKTTTVKLFTQRLLQLRSEGTRAPLPVLFDLRDVRITGLVHDMSLDHILASMLDAGRPVDIAKERLSPDIIRTRIAQGDTVVVFDGLDEVLVHLSPHDRQLFTRQLWRAAGTESGSRMLLTCRTQYFRTIREETTYFLGEGREGLRGNNYLALLMLPFRPEQVRDYLATNLDRDARWVEGFLATIAGVHDLPDLARRPLTLRLISDQVSFIESAKLTGRALRAVDLYREFVDRWLSRDSGKHTLDPEHKQLLMEEIAAAQWRAGQNSWTPAQVDDWLLEVLDRRPDLQRHYRERVPDLWKADFRTATFLSRQENTFAFAHRSLGEYFLARYLCRALLDTGVSDEPDAWAMPVPSPETLDFLGQLLAGLPTDQQSMTLAALARTATRYRPRTSELALAYRHSTPPQGHGHPHQSLVGLQLPGAQLGGDGGSGMRPRAGARYSP